MKTIFLLAISTTIFLNSFYSHFIGKIRATTQESQNRIKPEPDTTVYTVVETPPQFPGGTEGLFHFIRNSAKYPVSSYKSKNSQEVYLKLLIEKDGSISDVTVMKSDVNQEMQAEAKRIAWTMPKWLPGSQFRRKLRVYTVIVIHFKIN